MFIIPTNRGWIENNSGTGDTTQYPFFMSLWTGTTANSSALLWTPTDHLSTGDTIYTNTDFSKRLEFEFFLYRHDTATDGNQIARFQLKTANSEGQLADKGVGIQITNLSAVGEAYGSAKGTVSLGTMTLLKQKHFRIVIIPNTAVEFWVDNVLAGTLTGNTVPTGQEDCYLVASIINQASTSSIAIDAGQISFLIER